MDTSYTLDANDGRGDRDVVKWFRMYYEARNDAKLDTLSDAEHRVWFRLLCLAAEQEAHRGTVRKTRVVVAAEVAKGDLALLERTIARLVELEILSAEDGLTFLHFAGRNYDKPSDQPEATRGRQQKHRHAADDINNEDVTPMSRDVTPGHATEAELESELVTPPSPNGSGAPTARPPLAPKKKRTEPSPLREDQRTWVALREALGYEPHDGNNGERGRWNTAIADLRRSGKMAEDIPDLVAAYRKRWPRVECTPTAIAGNLSNLESPALPGTNGTYVMSDEERSEKRRTDEEWTRKHLPSP